MKKINITSARIILLTCVYLILSSGGCTSQPNVTTIEKESHTIANPSFTTSSTSALFADLNTDKLVVADGFHSGPGTAAARCIKFNPDDVEGAMFDPMPNQGQVTEFRLERLTDVEKIKEKLNIQASASFGYGIFSGDASYDLIKNSSINNYSNYVFVDVKVLNATRQLKNKVLTDEALNLAKTDMAQFYNKCGDEYIYGYRSGGQFTAVIQFISNSQQEYDSTSASLNASIGAGIFSADVNGNFKNSLESLKQNTTYKVYELRKGGVGALDSLDTVINTALQFPDKVKANGGNPWNFEYLTQSYTTTANFPSNSFPSYLQNLASVLGALSKWLDQAYVTRADLSYILSNPSQFEIPDKASLEQSFNSNETLISDLISRGSACLTDPSKDCILPTPPQFPDTKLKWIGKPPENCTIWKKSNSQGLYKFDIDAKNTSWSGYLGGNQGRPQQYPPAPQQFCGMMMPCPLNTGYLKLPHPNGVIYSVEYKCNGSGCGWSYDPGDHNPQDQRQVRYDIVDKGRAFRWYRLWQNSNISEIYTLYYAVPESAQGAACNTPEATNPSKDCRWYPQPESCQ